MVADVAPVMLDRLKSSLKLTVERVMREWDPEEKNHTFIRGYAKATGLYKLLYQYRNAGQVIIFDDADSVFLDVTGRTAKRLLELSNGVDEFVLPLTQEELKRLAP